MDFAPPAMEPATSLIGRPLEGPKTHTETSRAMSRAMAGDPTKPIALVRALSAGSVMS